ncbi:MAG TPA: TIGR00730 family Rossman fold protein [Actinomycetales bacterium]|nr:TIGR00730 family Rossman fold protein [Actinomycetales bacterium]
MVAVCVFCSSSEAIDARHQDLAAALGTELARRGHSLVSGGGRVSMMGAVARAARAGGARTVGVIPQALVGLEVADDDADDLVVTPDMRTRKARMDAAADAFVVLPGGIGTLEELLEVWVSRSLGMHSKPVVVCDPDGVYGALRDLVDDLVDAGFVRRAAAAELVWTSDVGAAVDAVDAGIAGSRLVRPDFDRVVSETLEAEP